MRRQAAVRRRLPGPCHEAHLPTRRLGTRARKHGMGPVLGMAASHSSTSSSNYIADKAPVEGSTTRTRPASSTAGTPVAALATGQRRARFNGGRAVGRRLHHARRCYVRLEARVGMASKPLWNRGVVWREHVVATQYVGVLVSTSVGKGMHCHSTVTVTVTTSR